MSKHSGNIPVTATFIQTLGNTLKSNKGAGPAAFKDKTGIDVGTVREALRRAKRNGRVTMNVYNVITAVKKLVLNPMEQINWNEEFDEGIKNTYVNAFPEAAQATEEVSDLPRVTAVRGDLVRAAPSLDSARETVSPREGPSADCEDVRRDPTSEIPQAEMGYEISQTATNPDSPLSARQAILVQTAGESLQAICPRESADEFQMMDVDKCQGDFKKYLSQKRADEAVEIQHLGLDLFMAHNRLVAMFKSGFAVKKVSLNMLVITSDQTKLGQRLPASIVEMTERVKPAVKHVIKSLRKLDQYYREQCRQLTIAIRSYAELPTIHGFSLISRGKRVTTYLSFCRWNQKGDDYDWGGDRYRRILGEPEDPSLRDMIEIFHGAFTHMWGNSEKCFDYVVGSDSFQAAE